MNKRNKLIIFILTLGVFAIINTEMGIVGILPLIAGNFHVSVSQAGLLVSLFALAVAIAGPTMPLLFSGINRRNVMLLVLGIFFVGNIISAFATSFTVILIARVVPAFFHPIYCSLAFTAASESVSKEEAPKAVAKVIMGVSAGMVLGVYSYFAEYLKNVTNIPEKTISLILLIYGVANIIGNIIAGKLLTKNAIKFVVSFHFTLGVVYIILFLMGQFTVPMALITLAWGILAGAGANINQYWIMSSASEAPDFANGLFLTSANLGTTFGTSVCGLLISSIGTQYIVLGGMLFLILSFVTVLARNYMNNVTRELSR